MTEYDALQKKLQRGQIKACIIQRRDEVTFEYYRNKKAENALHHIHSCSKSITSMLIGICMDEGLIPSIHTPIGEYFGKYLTTEKEKEKADITIYNLLTMTSGIDWREFGEWNYWSPMEFSNDIIKSALERDMAEPPGLTMNYNSGSSNLLSAIVQIASGMKTADFAKKYLFEPMGIEDFHWYEKQGINLGANGLKLRPHDMVKLGTLYLHEGQWNGKPVVPPEWVRESIKPRFMTYEAIGAYGYQWWSSELSAAGSAVPFYFAMGLFGQFIIVVPSSEIVAVFLSENYGETMKPMDYFREYFSEFAQL